jgi:hypothetical protein
MILNNQLLLTRNYVMINNAAGRVIENWMGVTESRIAAITRGNPEQPEMGIKKIDAVASTAESMNRCIWSSQVRSCQDQFTAARTNLLKKEFFNAFSRLIKNNLITFEERKCRTKTL